MKSLKLLNLLLCAVLTLTACNNDSGGELIPTVPYPETADPHGKINQNGIELFLSQHLLENIKPVAINLIAQYVPVEEREGQRFITVALPGVSLETGGIALAIRDECLGDDGMSEAIAAADCTTDANSDFQPTYRSTISISLEELEKALTIKFDHAADGQGLGIELDIDHMPISIDMAVLIDLGEMLGLSGTCHVHDKWNADGTTDAAVNINHIGVKVAASSIPTMDGHSLLIALEKADLDLTGEQDSLLNMQVSPCDGQSTACSDPFCLTHDCSDLCQTADILTQILGNLSEFLEDLLSGVANDLIAQYVAPLFSQVGNMLPLPIETAFDLGSLLTTLGTPFNNLYLSVDMASAGLNTVSTQPAASAAIALDFGLTAQKASCMEALGPAPDLPLDPDLPSFSSYLVDTPNQSTINYEAAVALSERNLAQVFWAFLNGGIACMSLSSNSIAELSGGSFNLTSGLLKLFIPEMSVLGPDNSPLFLEVQPKAWPTLSLGNMEAGEDLLNLDIPSLTISIYMLANERPVRIVELNLAIRAGLSILRTANGITIAIKSIDFVTIEQTFNQLFPNSDISILLPSILDSLGGQFLNGIEIPIDLESTLNSLLGGFGVHAGIEGIATTPATIIPGYGHWLTLYASAGPTSSNVKKRLVKESTLTLPPQSRNTDIQITIPQAAGALAYRTGLQPWHLLTSNQLKKDWSIPAATTVLPGDYTLEVLTYNTPEMETLPQPQAKYKVAYTVVDQPKTVAAVQTAEKDDKQGCNSTGTLPSLWFLAISTLLLFSRNKKFRPFMALLIVPLFASCNTTDTPAQTDSEDTPLPEEKVYAAWATSSTALSPAVITAGNDTTVSCTLTTNGNISNVEWTITVDGNKQDCSGNSCVINMTQAGSHNVTCQAAGVDSSSAILSVQPATISMVAAILDPSVVTSGQTSNVTCRANDSYGNIIEENNYELVLPEGVSLQNGNSLLALKAGTYQIGCQISGLEGKNATLTVQPGEPANIETIISTPTLIAGNTTDLSCIVTDRGGNILPDQDCQFVVKALSDTQNDTTTINDHAIYADQAGSLLIFAYQENGVADNTPAIISVIPATPVKMSCPGSYLGCFAKNKPLNIGCSLQDRFGNTSVDWPLEYIVNGFRNDSSTDEEGNLLFPHDPSFDWNENGQPLFLADGIYDIIVRPLDADSDADASTDLIHNMTVVVDNTPPAITTEPASGSLKLGGTDDIYKITVKTSVNEPLSDPAYTIIDGTSYPVNTGKTVTVTKTGVPTRFGLNILEAAANDGCNNSRSQINAFLRAPDTYPPAIESTPDTHVQDGLGLVLSQEFLDDGNRGDGNNQESYDDIASIIVNFIGEDLSTLINGSIDASNGVLVENGNLVIKRTDGAQIELDSIIIDNLTIIDGGLQLEAHVGKNDNTTSIKFPATVSYKYNLFGEHELKVGGTITMDSLGIDTNLGISFSSGKPNITMGKPELELDNLKLDIEGLNLIDGLINLILDLLNNVVEGLVGNLLADNIPPLLIDLLGSINIGTSFTLPEPLNVTLGLDAAMSTINFYGASGNKQAHGIIGFSTQLYPAACGVDNCDMGAVKHKNNPPAEPGIADGMAISLKDDFLNQALWAIWYGGVLNMDLGSLIAASGLEGMDFKMKAEMPPVIMPGSTAGEIELGLGNLYLDATFDLAKLTGQQGLPPLQAQLYANVFLPGKLAVTDGALSFAISETNDVRILTDVISVNGDMANLEQFNELINRVLGKVLPSLLSSILTSIPIPGINLSDLGIASLPENTMLSIGMEDLTRPGELSTRLTGTIAITHE